MTLASRRPAGVDVSHRIWRTASDRWPSHRAGVDTVTTASTPSRNAACRRTAIPPIDPPMLARGPPVSRRASATTASTSRYSRSPNVLTPALRP
jgi:hypothetical protein